MSSNRDTRTRGIRPDLPFACAPVSGGGVNAALEFARLCNEMLMCGWSREEISVAVQEAAKGSQAICAVTFVTCLREYAKMAARGEKLPK